MIKRPAPFGSRGSLLNGKIGRKSILMLSYILWAGVCLILTQGPNRLMIILTFAFYGAHKGALEPVQKTFVSELAPKEFRASCLGGFQMIIGLCAFPASLIAGLLWESSSMFAPFYFSLVLTVSAGIMLTFVKE